MTQYVSKIYLKRLMDNIQRKSDNTAVKTSVEANTKAIETLNGDSTVEGSVKKAIKDVVGAAPEALDTLEEIAAQLNNDESATTALTGTITKEIERAKKAEETNSTNIATNASNISTNTAAINNLQENKLDKADYTPYDDKEVKESIASNSTAISNETSRAKAAEQANTDKINANTAAINVLNGDSTVEGSVKKAIKDLIGTAPEALDTLGEIATQLQNNESAASALTNEIAAKANTTDVYSKTESDEKYQPKGNYLTEHQDLSSYAKLNDLSSYAKTNEVGIKVDTANNVDFAITDKNDNTLCIFEDGHIKTKNFDSSLLSTLFLNKFQGKTIAILGDSISTYTGWLPSDVAGYNGAKYEVYYPHGDVKSASDTWWYKVAVGLGMNPTTQISNCAWSGSKVTGDSTSTTSAAAGCSNRRITDLSLRLNGKAPDIIICYISCNDWGNGVAVGDWSVDSDVPSEGTISTFREAYALMLYKIHKAYPYARVFCCTNLDDTSRDRATGFPSNNSNAVSVKTWNDSIIEIAEAFGCDVINLHDCGINYANISNFVVDAGLHPNAVGHTLMARKIVSELFAKY